MPLRQEIGAHAAGQQQASAAFEPRDDGVALSLARAHERISKNQRVAAVRMRQLLRRITPPLYVVSHFFEQQIRSLGPAGCRRVTRVEKYNVEKGMPLPSR